MPILSDPNGEITSPGYPDNYPNDNESDWLIQQYNTDNTADDIEWEKSRYHIKTALMSVLMKPKVKQAEYNPMDILTHSFSILNKEETVNIKLVPWKKCCSKLKIEEVESRTSFDREPREIMTTKYQDTMIYFNL